MQQGPLDSRATFELFRFYRPEIGIERLFYDAGLGKMSPRNIYHAVHNRPPDSLESASPSGNFNSVDLLVAALSSGEFQEHMAAHYLAAFPEKRRLFFVHIPKTAGVDLASHLISRFPSISTTLLDRHLTPQPATLFLALKHIVLESAFSDTIFISGHTPLGNYRAWNGNGIRYQDQVFTVVRDPLDQIISQVNYALTRMFSDERPIAPDTAGWRREFGFEQQDQQRQSRDEILRLARRILRHQGVVVPNVICRFLGGGSLQTSLIQTVAHDLEVVDLKHLDAWSEQKWNIKYKSQLNSSQKFISKQDLSTDDLEYARGIIQDDLQYYGQIERAYQRHGGTSVRGIQILD